jgi:ribosomal protein S18 acetylase RimI-like enzyme
LASDAVERAHDGVSFRCATLADAHAIAHVHCMCWRETYAGLLPQAVIDHYSVFEQRVAMWEKALAQGSGSVWVALENENLVAFAKGGAARANEEGCDAQLYVINALKIAHGKGIGRALVRLVFYELRASGFSSVRVEVLYNNSTAIRFYEKLGAVHVRDETSRVLDYDVIDSVYVWRTLTV